MVINIRIFICSKSIIKKRKHEYIIHYYILDYFNSVNRQCNTIFLCES